jgi:hypothetical protein
MADPRLAILDRIGIQGEDALTALALFDAHGGMRAARDALTQTFGNDAVRVALVLLKG